MEGVSIGAGGECITHIKGRSEVPRCGMNGSPKNPQGRYKRKIQLTTPARFRSTMPVHESICQVRTFVPTLPILTCSVSALKLETRKAKNCSSFFDLRASSLKMVTSGEKFKVLTIK